MHDATDAQEVEQRLHESAGRKQHVAPQYLERRHARRKSAGFVSGRSKLSHGHKLGKT